MIRLVFILCLGVIFASSMESRTGFAVSPKIQSLSYKSTILLPASHYISFEGAYDVRSGNDAYLNVEFVREDFWGDLYARLGYLGSSSKAREATAGLQFLTDSMLTVVGATYTENQVYPYIHVRYNLGNLEPYLVYSKDITLGLYYAWGKQETLLNDYFHVLAPKSGLQTTDKDIIVKGYYLDTGDVYLNGKSLALRADGMFIVKVPLTQMGLNQIHIMFEGKTVGYHEETLDVVRLYQAPVTLSAVVETVPPVTNDLETLKKMPAAALPPVSSVLPPVGAADEMSSKFSMLKTVLELDRQSSLQKVSLSDLKFLVPFKDQRVSETPFHIKGTGPAGTVLKVNGNKMTIDKQGRFRADIPLRPGYNRMLLTLGDEKQDIQILYLKQYNDLPPKDMFTPLLEKISMLNFFNTDDRFYPAKSVSRRELFTALVKVGYSSAEELGKLSSPEQSLTYEGALNLIQEQTQIAIHVGSSDQSVLTRRLASLLLYELPKVKSAIRKYYPED